MKSVVRPFVVGLMMIGLFLGASAVATPAEIYTATMVETRDLLEPRKADLVLTVEQFNTAEDAAKLQAVYKESGSDGLIAAMRKMDQGTVDVEGVRTARVHYVRVREGQDGNTVVMVTEKPFYFPGEAPDPRAVGALGVIQINLNREGMGNGTVAAAVAINLEEDGSLRVQAFDQATITLEDVTQKASDNPD